MGSASDQTTELLVAWSHGDSAAGDRLLPRVYDELRAIAARRLGSERGDHTLQPTELVHEMFLRLFGAQRLGWQDRAHFFAVAATMMRRILVDHARRRRRGKRGGDALRISLARLGDISEQRTPDLVALDGALDRLAAIDERKARIVELHFFAGLSVAETAEVLGCSTATVTRHWRMAKAMLLRELEA